MPGRFVCSSVLLAVRAALCRREAEKKKSSGSLRQMRRRLPPAARTLGTCRICLAVNSPPADREGREPAAPQRGQTTVLNAASLLTLTLHAEFTDVTTRLRDQRHQSCVWHFYGFQQTPIPKIGPTDAMQEKSKQTQDRHPGDRCSLIRVRQHSHSFL